MGAREAIGCRTHRGQTPGILKERIDASAQFLSISHAQSSTRRNRILGCLQEVESVWPDQDRTTTGRGLDQILPAKRQQATANEGQVGKTEIGRHLAHTIAEPDLGICSRQVLATPH